MTKIGKTDFTKQSSDGGAQLQTHCHKHDTISQSAGFEEDQFNIQQKVTSMIIIISHQPTK